MENQKNQIVDRVKQATNILVAVSSNPSVDQLSAAIGLTLMLNHIGKHATAVFSGEVPSTLEFLQPEKTLEKNTDSLRDFIIALDKSKADKLRYKVEDQMVKIFITPYRTSISDKDLQFSQGDFNVEVVIALGVNDQADLDQAITSHGRILHDATVIGLGVDGGALGTLNWSDPAASSLCELVTGIGLALKADVLDSQMATALLTGIVAETERFSNEKTSSETMQVSAKLMSAGANQQLVASQLEKPEPEPTPNPAPMPVPEPASADDAELPEVNEEPVPAPEPLPVLQPEPAPAPQPEQTPPAKESSDGSLVIDHGEGRLADELASEAAEPEVEQIHIDEQGILKSAKEVEAMKQKVIQPLSPEEVKQPKSDSRLILEPPTLGGKLTANSEPEGLDPATDPLRATTQTGPMLSHEEPRSQDTATAAPADSLAELEKSVESPHIVENKAPQTGVDAARDAVMNAVTGVSPSILEPVQALNAQPMDLNADPQIAIPPIVVDTPRTPLSELSHDSGMPTGLVPPDPGLPTDNTASIVTDPTAPPPVPPPMMPPTDFTKPADTAL